MCFRLAQDEKTMGNMKKEVYRRRESVSEGLCQETISTAFNAQWLTEQTSVVIMVEILSSELKHVDVIVASPLTCTSRQILKCDVANSSFFKT